MRWRCEACGKPHERNDPPCDNCGHHAFERAVVPQAPEGDAEQDSVWVCADCGRAHQRNSPPCSRCGSMQFEQRTADYLDVDEAELQSAGWLEVVEGWQLAVGAVALVVAAALVLGAVGVIDLPGTGPPTVSDVPGESESAAGLSLSTVEDEYVAALNDHRAESGDGSLARTAPLDRAATYYNQRYVKAAYGDGERPAGDAIGRFDHGCEQTPTAVLIRLDATESLSTVENEGALAEELLATYLDERQGTVPGTRLGVDVHVVDDTVYLTQISC